MIWKKPVDTDSNTNRRNDMTPSDMIDELNKDLANEYKHWHFYLNAGIRVQGLHREQMRAFLFKEAASEMEHIKVFGDLILGLGGTPNTKVNGFRGDLTNPRAILEYALVMEEEVVSNYVERKKQAQKMGGVNGSRIEIFMDSQIEQSATDADNIRQMIMGV